MESTQGGAARPPEGDPSTHAAGGGVALAFAIVYVVWGSTYLAIRFVVEALPPLLMASARFTTAGGALYLWARRRGAPRATGREWRGAAVVGVLLLLAGNGLVCWAEQWVPSGLAALLIASVPLWMALFHGLTGGGRPAPRVLAGLVVGVAGVALLVGEGATAGGDGRVLAGAVGLVLAAAFWAAGSLASRKVVLPAAPLLATGMEMLAGGAALLVVGTLLGEWGDVRADGFTVKSVLSLVYLVLFGSILAFSAYIWLLRVCPPAKVSTYAYVNPVVAVLLGWAAAGEALTARTLLAAAVILAAVVLITTAGRSSGGK